DPFRARSEGESAEYATPIPAPNTVGTLVAPSSTVIEPIAVHAPLAITPAPRIEETPTIVAPPPAPAPVAAPVDSAPRPRLSSAPVSPVIAPAAALASATEAARVATAATPTVLETEDEQPLFTSAEKRLFATVPDEIESYFDLFMYVSKSNRGPFA